MAVLHLFLIAHSIPLASGCPEQQRRTMVARLATIGFSRHMTLLNQLLLGSLFLSLCLILEICVLLWGASKLTRTLARQRQPFTILQIGLVLVAAIFVILGSHTIQVWIWSSAFVLVGAIDDWNSSVYFSLVTYTTLGYGDVVVGPPMRIFAALASVNGLFGFGISTAFLVGLMHRLFSIPGHTDPRDN